MALCTGLTGPVGLKEGVTVYPKTVRRNGSATLASDAPRDNRMGWRRISRAIPHALKTPEARGQSPRLRTDIFPEQLADIIAEQ